MLSEIDRSIQSQAEEISKLLKDQTISPASKEIVLRTFQATKTNFVLILNHQNEIIVQSQSFPIDEKLYISLTGTIGSSLDPQFINHEKGRFYLSPLINNGMVLGTVVVGDSVSAMNEAFGVLVNTLTLIFFLFLVPLVLMSFLEADISLLPLRDLATKMNTITTKNLSSRVDTLNPKDEIGEVSTAFNKLLDRLQKGFVKEQQLIHDVSHQLKTPLTAMRSEIEIGLAKKRSSDVYQKILHNVLTDTNRMAHLLKDMMNFAWAASDNQDKGFTKQNLSTILEEVAEISQQLGLDKRIEVATSIMPNVFILGHREKLFQIFVNILENSIKYSHKNGTIFIQVSTGNNQAKVIIKDCGIGICKKDLPHIFERFYRGSSPIDEGTGLGISIASALTKAHKGTIEVSSQRYKGTTFVVSLPLVIAPLNKQRTKKRSRSKTIKRPHVRTFLREQFCNLGRKQ